MLSYVQLECDIKISYVIKTATDNGSNMVNAFKVFGKSESNVVNPEGLPLVDEN